MDIYTQEVTTKYGKEYAAVEDMVDNIVLTDAVASVKPASASVGVGFGVSPVAAITFAPAQAGGEEAAQAHANKFAETINKFFFVKGADGKQVPLVDRDLVKVDGTTVNVNLGEVHKLFTQQPVLPVELNISMLSQAANQYSKQSVAQAMVQQAHAQVDGAVQQRKAQKAMEATIYPECEKVLENIDYLAELGQKDPRTAALVQQVLKEVAVATAEVQQSPEALEQIRAANPKFAGLVEKSVEKAKEAPVKPEQKKFASRVKDGDLAKPKEASAGRG